ncbi:MAG: carboxymuconolactone decarboxylase family protein [Pseudomonadota bacterium]
MTDASIFAAMQKASEDWAKAASPWMEAMAPTMPKDVLETFFGKGISPDGLDAKTRLLLTLGGLTTLGATAEPQIKITVRNALEAGATQQEIIETIAQMSVFGGVPAMTKAMELARAVMEEDKP